MPMSATLSQDMLNYYFTTGSPITRPTAWYLSLHTADPGRTGANELTTGSDSAYARKAATFAVTDAEADGIYEAKNTADITMNAAGAGASYTITHVAVWTASTAGTLLGVLQLASPVAVVAGGVVSFATGDIIFQGV